MYSDRETLSMSRPRSARQLEGLYFEWLYSHVGRLSAVNPGRSHTMLAEQMHVTPFVEYVPNDGNRANDGLDLRVQFCEMVTSRFTAADISGPCSMLEMTIALAQRVEYETAGTNIDHEFADWYWKLMGHAGLAVYTDEAYLDSDHARDRVEVILDRIVERRYSRSGALGFFPLKHGRGDQRTTELWDQMSAYILENSDIRT